MQITKKRNALIIMVMEKIIFGWERNHCITIIYRISCGRNYQLLQILQKRMRLIYNSKSKILQEVLLEK